MALLRREEFLAIPLAHEDVKVRGGVIRVWELNADQLPGVKAAEQASNAEWAIRFCAACCGDESGPFSPQLTAAEFRGRSDYDCAALVKVAFRLNRITKEEVEQIKGNSPSEPGADSPTGSPAT